MSKKPSKKKSIKKDNNKEIEAIRKLRDLDEKLNRTSIENALLPNPSEGEESATDALESNLLGDKFLEKKDEPTDSSKKPSKKKSIKKDTSKKQIKKNQTKVTKQKVKSKKVKKN
jgi:hypothetical protein